VFLLALLVVFIQTTSAGCGCPGCDYDEGSSCARCCSSFIKRQLVVDEDLADEACYCGIGCLIGRHCPLCCRQAVAGVGRLHRADMDVAEIIRLLNDNRSPTSGIRQRPIADDTVRTP